MYSSACMGVAGGLALPLMALCIGEGQQQAVGLTELDMAAAKQLFLLRGDIVKEEEEEEEEDGRERKRAGSLLHDKGRKAREGGFRGRKRFRSIDYIYKKTQPLNVRHLIKRLKV